MPWLLAEDEALKAKFANLLTVVDINNATRPVSVRFRLPENEIANLTYPNIIIDHLGFSKASDREHRGHTRLPYAPEGQQPLTYTDNTDTSYDPALSTYLTQFPTPYDIDYQITVSARKILHMMALRGSLAQFDFLPARFGYLAVHQDGTVRRLDIIGGPLSDDVRDQDGKRIFRDVYTVRVSSELIWADIDAFNAAVQVALTVTQTPDTYN